MPNRTVVAAQLQKNGGQLALIIFQKDCFEFDGDFPPQRSGIPFHEHLHGFFRLGKLHPEVLMKITGEKLISFRKALFQHSLKWKSQWIGAGVQIVSLCTSAPTHFLPGLNSRSSSEN
jgi:hypothetical protein